MSFCAYQFIISFEVVEDSNSVPFELNVTKNFFISPSQTSPSQLPFHPVPDITSTMIISQLLFNHSFPMHEDDIQSLYFPVYTMISIQQPEVHSNIGHSLDHYSFNNLFY